MKYFISLLCLLFAAATTSLSPEEEFVFVGDVAIPKEEYESENLTRAGVTLKSELWPKGIVYYKINEDRYSTSEFCKGDGYLQSIYDSIKEYHKYTCIKFRLKDDDDTSIKNWVTVDEYGPGCFAERVGFSNKIKSFKMNLQNSGNSYCPRGTITHEFGHLLGLSHEHNREDRDYYVNVHWENIEDDSGSRYQFKKDNDPDTYQHFSNYEVPFNYNSMMLYPTWFLQKKPGLKTMSSKSNMTNSMGNPDDSFWGKANGLTQGDQLILNKMYNCKGTYPQAPLDRNEQNPLCPGYNGVVQKPPGAGTCKRKARK